ncbi:UDP-glucose:undecaprenyl-phosphate glucose-1-phosphate transferase [Candidatus Methylobacter favarea]|uniref:UDP-glucose:undecaprenyl-phosphate glucose-1-phosphate transferase n=1 Tax=Candidatus Methylobacter favarea TaxID=2707345 RepID=A0A8S0WQX6_9GAMM|nr:undecaprenyl-phosphate glucose phosphotransferase [Candidatus Methylobacter favarea]CAA9891679.1 UDP-glucose:undecaprenyl-phosphate glucose-1-phosphate transferase [Candidatus Methylobacter favarea]
MNQERSLSLIRPSYSALNALSRAFDSGLILVSLYISMNYYGIPISQDYLLSGIGCIILFGIFSEYNDIYQGWRGEPIFDKAVRILVSWMAAFMLIFISIFLFGNPYSYLHAENSIELFLLLVPALIILTHTIRRLVLAFLRRHGLNSRTYAILGANHLGKRLETAISQMPWLGYNFKGYYDDRTHTANRRLDLNRIDEPDRRPPNSNNLKFQAVGKFTELLQDAQLGKIDHVYITLPLCAEKRVSDMISKLADSTVSVNIVPDFFTFNLIQSKWSNVQGIPVVSVFDTPFTAFDGLLKRIEDLLLCAIILPLISLPMLIIAIGIKLTSSGPVIFKQTRYGINGENIAVLKFRTMAVCENGDNIKQATFNDSRVTPFGAFLRKTSLDELPQFFNVLQGQMSVVGPRPHAVAHNEHYRKRIQGYMLRHKVKPGITGQAQISGFRGETDTLDKMEARIHHDLEYIKQWSLWLDIKIIFITIFKGFSGNQAY